MKKMRISAFAVLVIVFIVAVHGRAEVETQFFKNPLPNLRNSVNAEKLTGGIVTDSVLTVAYETYLNGDEGMIVRFMVINMHIPPGEEEVLFVWQRLFLHEETIVYDSEYVIQLREKRCWKKAWLFGKCSYWKETDDGYTEYLALSLDNLVRQASIMSVRRRLLEGKFLDLGSP